MSCEFRRGATGNKSPQPSCTTSCNIPRQQKLSLDTTTKVPASAGVTSDSKIPRKERKLRSVFANCNASLDSLFTRQIMVPLANAGDAVQLTPEVEMGKKPHKSSDLCCPLHPKGKIHSSRYQPISSDGKYQNQRNVREVDRKLESKSDTNAVHNPPRTQAPKNSFGQP